MKKKGKITIIVVIIVLLLLAAIATYVSFAFFRTTDTEVNKVTLGNIDIDLTEPNFTGDTKTLIPGTTLVKDPTLKATSGSSYARIIVEFYDTDSGSKIDDTARINKIKETICYDSEYSAEGSPYKTPNLVEGNTYTKQDLTTKCKAVGTDLEALNYNNTNFTLDKTRSSNNKLVFNYASAGEATSMNQNDTAVLFTNIVVPADFTNEEMKLLGKFEIRIKAEAIQSIGFASAELAYSELD